MRVSTISAISTSRMRVAGPQTGRKGLIMTEEGEKLVAMAYIRKCFSLLGRLETVQELLWPGEGGGKPLTLKRGTREQQERLY